MEGMQGVSRLLFVRACPGALVLLAPLPPLPRPLAVAQVTARSQSVCICAYARVCLAVCVGVD